MLDFPTAPFPTTTTLMATSISSSNIFMANRLCSLFRRLWILQSNRLCSWGCWEERAQGHRIMHLNSQGLYSWFSALPQTALSDFRQGAEPGPNLICHLLIGYILGFKKHSLLQHECAVGYVPDAPLLTHLRCSTDQPSTQHASGAQRLWTSATALSSSDGQRAPTVVFWEQKHTDLPILLLQFLGSCPNLYFSKDHQRNLCTASYWFWACDWKHQMHQMHECYMGTPCQRF